MESETVSKLRVLLIEDDPGAWPELISDMVRPFECEFDVKPNDGRAIPWASDARIDGRYDLVICNLVCQQTGQNYGRLIIEKLRSRFPQLPIIVLSGMEDAHDNLELAKLMNELYATHKVQYVALRHGGKVFDLAPFRKVFSDVFRTISAPSNSVWDTWEWKSTDGTEQIPEGVIRSVLRGLNDELPDSAFAKHCRDQVCGLAVATEDRRIHFAVELWEHLWLQESGLPYLTFIRKLAEREFSREMYSEYRDHVAHSIWVYLLGLYLYQGNNVLRDAIRSKFSEVEFKRAWKIAALFHDIGYTCDSGIDQEEEFVKPILQELQRFTNFPLREYLAARKYDLSEEDENMLAQLGHRHTPLQVTLNNIEQRPLSGAPSKLLDLIEEWAIPTQLGQRGQTTPLGNYYLLGKSVKPKPTKLERFRDHGILSALLLLHQFDRFVHCLQTLAGITLPTRIERDVCDELTKIISEPVTNEYTQLTDYA